MKTQDLSQTALVRKFGVRGARLFGRIWFPVMYLFLIALTAGFLILSPTFGAGWRDMVVGCLVAVLVVTAAALLTRMRLEFLAGIEKLERTPMAEPGTSPLPDEGHKTA
jgi:hypothetical protein